MSDPDLALLDGVAWRGHAVPEGRGRDLLAALVPCRAAQRAGRPTWSSEVWGDDEPAHPDKALQVLVSRVRSQTDADVGRPRGQRVPPRPALRPGRPAAPAPPRRRRRRPRARAGDLDVARLQARAALDQSRSRPPAARDRSARPSQAGPTEQARRAAAPRRGAAGPRRRRRGAAPARGDPRGRPGRRGRLAEVLRAEAQVRGVPAALARFASYAERIRDEPRRLTRRPEPPAPARRAAGPRGARPRGPEVRRDAAGRPRRRRGPRSAGCSRARGSSRSSEPVGWARPGWRTWWAAWREQPVVHFVELAGVTAPDGVLPEVGGSPRRARVGDQRAHRPAARRPARPGGRAALGAADAADPRQLRAPRRRGRRPRRVPGGQHRRDQRAHHHAGPAGDRRRAGLPAAAARQRGRRRALRAAGAGRPARRTPRRRRGDGPGRPPRRAAAGDRAGRGQGAGRCRWPRSPAGSRTGSRC